MSDPIQTTANSSANAAATTGAAGGMVIATNPSWLDEHSMIIGVVCTILSLLLALIFHIINTRLNARFAKREAGLKQAELIAKWTDEGKTEDQISYYLKQAGVEDAS